MVHEFDVGFLLYDLSFVISYSSSSSCAYFMSTSILLQFKPRQQLVFTYIPNAPAQLAKSASALYSLQPIPPHEIFNHLAHLIRRLKTMPMTNMRQYLHALMRTQD